MSESCAPDEFIAKRRMRLRVALIAAILPALVICNAANAQVSGMVSPTPTIGATSPLGITTGSTVSPTGIPLGSTEIASPGVSPAPLVTGTVSMSGSGASCSTLGTSPSGMYGSTATCDGGDIGNVDVIGDVGDVGNVDNFGHAGNLGHVGNVRLGLKQHRLFFDSLVDVTDHAWRGRSNRDSAGVYRDRQPWGQFRRSNTNDRRAADNEFAGDFSGANDACCCSSARPFIHDDGKHCAGSDQYDDEPGDHSGRLGLFSPASERGHEKESNHHRCLTGCRNCGRRSVLHACTPAGEGDGRARSATPHADRRRSGGPT